MWKMDFVFVYRNESVLISVESLFPSNFTWYDSIDTEMISFVVILHSLIDVKDVLVRDDNCS